MSQPVVLRLELYKTIPTFDVIICMNSIEKAQDKPLECPVSDKGRGNFKRWFKRFGIAGFLFFLIKGLLWLIIPYLIAKGIINIDFKLF